MAVNNVIRYLEKAGIRFTAFNLPEEKISAVDTATLLAIPPELVYKSIVVISSEKPILCVVAGNQEVDLKLVANVIGEKKVKLANQDTAEKLTGLQVGGISPLSLINRGFKVICDISIQDHEEIHISGGQRGLNIRINVEDLLKVLHPEVASISRQMTI
jgi:Cys-tRNA(Pro)/Cys-tRNA(Cys) deacylase